MALTDVQTLLENILKAVYGRDVRQSIHDAIKQCYYDGKAGAYDLEARDRARAAEARMDTFTNLAEGSTTGDAELMDIRVGLDGTTYANAGTSVREQIRNTRVIEVSSTEPTRDNTVMWINNDETDSFDVPEIKDWEQNLVDTWSSKKIAEKIAEVYNAAFYIPEVNNLYNPALQTPETISPHYYVDGHPYESPQFDTAYNATALIEIEPNTQYTIGLVPAWDAAVLPWYQASFGLFYYDADEKYIGLLESGVGTFTTPINAKYIRFNYAITAGIRLERLNERCMLVKGDTLPTEYTPYVGPISVKQRLDGVTGMRTAYRVEEDSIILSTKYTNDKDIQYVLKRKGGNNLFDFYHVYLFDNASLVPAVHSMSGVSPFISGGGDWHSPFKVKAVNNANGDQVGNDYFTGGNHQYNNNGSGSTPTASHVSLEFIADGVSLKSGDNGYARTVEMTWVSNVQGQNTSKADGSGREILQERHRMIFDGYEFDSLVELVPLEDILLLNWYGFQGFYEPYEFVQYLDGTNRSPKALSVYSESGDATTSKMRMFNSAGDAFEIEVDTTFDLGKRTYFSGTASMFSSTYGKVYSAIVSKSTELKANCVYSARGKYRFKSALAR